MGQSGDEQIKVAEAVAYGFLRGSGKISLTHGKCPYGPVAKAANHVRHGRTKPGRGLRQGPATETPGLTILSK